MGSIILGDLSNLQFKVGSGDCSIYLGDTKLWPTAPTAYKFQATYSDGTDYKVQCNSSSILTTNEARGHSTSYSTMTTAIIGDCVTTIESATFYNFPNLESIILSDNLTSIGTYTFSRCTKLVSIEIPSGVTSIESNAFSSCSNLTTINIPNGVTSIDNYIFSYCKKLSAVTIPSDVTQIGNSSFSTCGSLTSIDISSGVTSIGNSAFYYCNSLTSITVNAVTPPTLGTNVFYNTNNCPIYVPCESVDAYKSATNWSTYADRIQGIPPCTSKQWVSYSEADSVPNYGVYGIKFQSSANHEYVEYPSYIQFVDENNNYISIYYDGGNWYLETSSGAEEITFDYETDYATIIFDDYGVGAATIDEMALLSMGMPFDMQLYELN